MYHYKTLISLFTTVTICCTSLHIKILIMKKFHFYVCFALVFISCQNQNKSVIEKLDVKEISELIKEDPMYETIISEIEDVRDLIEKDIVVQGKFKDLSYGEYLKYTYSASDTALIKRIKKQARQICNSYDDSILNLYRNDIDSKLEEYRQIYNTIPSNTFSAKFVKVDKETNGTEYYSKTKVFIHFKITPILGVIQGGSFRYEVYPKPETWGLFKLIDSGGCRFTEEIGKSSVFIWELSGRLRDLFINMNSNEISECYNFVFEMLSVKIDDETYFEEQIHIPRIYLNHLESNWYISEEAYLRMIEYQYGRGSSYYNVYKGLLNDEKRKLNHLAWDFEKFL